MKPANVKQIMLTIIAGCIIGTVLKYIDIAGVVGAFAGKEMIIRAFIIFIMTAFMIISYDFYDKIIAFTKETVWESQLTLALTGFFGALLYLAANHTWYSLLAAGFLSLLLKAWSLYRAAKKRQPAYQPKVVLFFKHYVKSYFFAFLLTLPLLLVDLHLFSFEDTFNGLFNPAKPKEIAVINAELAKIPSSVNITTLKTTINGMSNQLSSLNTTLGIVYFLGILTFVILFIYVALFSAVLKNMKKSEVVAELKRTNFPEDKNAQDFVSFSLVKPLFLVTRPVVSLVSGIISSSIYFAYQGNLGGSILLFLTVYLTTSFGFAINDYFDIEKDKINHPERVLPRGLIQKKSVLFFCFGVLLISIWASLNISVFAFSINLITLTLLTLYSVINNKYGIAANFITAFCSALVLIIAKPDLRVDIVLLSSVSTFLFILWREIVFDIQDIEGDKWMSKTSFPILVGVRRSFKLAGLVLLANTLLTLLIGIVFKSSSYIIFVGIASNILSWACFINYIKNQNRQAELLFTHGTRLAILLIIPALLLHA